MNQLRAAKQSVSLYTPLTLRIGPMLEMAMIFLGVGLNAAIGHDVSKQLPLWNPENTFFGIQFYAEPSEVCECCGQICDQVASLSCFHHYVIYIDGDCWFQSLDLVRLVGQVDLVGEASLHAPLIGGTSVLQTKRYGYVTIPYGVMNEVAT